MRDLIFVITTGRSGTEWLAKQLKNNLKDSSVNHEAYPALSLREYNKGLWNDKKNNILKELKTNNLYVETNHMFIKTFYKDALENFRDRIKVIILEREPELVARSMYSLGTIPGESELAKDWYIDPSSKTCFIKCPEEDKITKCLWACYEVRARAKKFQKDFLDIPVYKISLNELQDVEGFKNLLNWIGEEHKADSIILDIVPKNKSPFIKRLDTPLKKFIEKKEAFEK